MNYFETLDNLIILNKEHRTKYIDASKTMNSASFAAQFQTVRCFIGRQIGSSTYINEKATENDLIIVSKSNQKSNYQPKATILSFSQVEHDAVGKYFENIYVNEPTFLFNLVRDDKFYQILAKNTEQTFILLGT